MYLLPRSMLNAMRNKKQDNIQSLVNSYYALASMAALSHISSHLKSNDPLKESEYSKHTKKMCMWVYKSIRSNEVLNGGIQLSTQAVLATIYVYLDIEIYTYYIDR